MNERLLYNGTKRIPEIYNTSEIEDILQHILISKDYLKSDWGDWMRQRDICLIATVYILGLRPKEACCLKFSDFNLKTATVKIRGENNKVRKDRVLPTPAILIKFYKKYFQFPRARFWKGSKYLFPSMGHSHISTKRLEATLREKILKPLRLWHPPAKCGSSKQGTYKLRHSRASHILKKQIENNGQPDLYAIANLLGHSDLRSTTVYLHTDERYMDYLRGQMEF